MVPAVVTVGATGWAGRNCLSRQLFSLWHMRCRIAVFAGPLHPRDAGARGSHNAEACHGSRAQERIVRPGLERVSWAWK